MATFKLTLHKAYYTQGVFNVPVDYDQYVRPGEGLMYLMLDGGQTIQGHVNRTANWNGTSRIMGRSALRDWFQGNFKQRDVVEGG